MKIFCIKRSGVTEAYRPLWIGAVIDWPGLDLRTEIIVMDDVEFRNNESTISNVIKAHG